MIKTNYFEDNEDINLQINELIDWAEITGRYENGFQGDDEHAPSSTAEALDYYKTVLNGHGDFAGNYMSEYAAELDHEGLKFEGGKVIHPDKMVALAEKYHQAGFMPMAYKRDWGGLGLPQVVKSLNAELMYRADTSMSIAFSSISLAAILERHASTEQKDRWLPKFCSELITATMGLTEPDYGSDLPGVRTKAVEKDGSWYITGTKRFQTMACGLNQYPGITLCLARSGDKAGARGLSFFLVESKDIEITGIEHKMGLRGSATCETAMEDAPAELIGQQGAGLVQYVMGMLNGARMSVAAQGCGLATAAYKEASLYASQREQFGRPIIQIPAVKRLLDDMECEIIAMRSLMIEGARSVDMYIWDLMRTEAKGERPDNDQRFWEKLSSTITPLSKYYNAETANRLLYKALQVFGGSGFIEEYDIARLYRDCRITSLYDGTSEIQVNAAIGPVVTGMSAGGVFRRYLENFAVSEEPWGRLFKEYEGITALYKGLADRELKEAYSREVVEAACRLLNTTLLFDSVKRCKSPSTADKRMYMARRYASESLGCLAHYRQTLNDLAR